MNKKKIIVGIFILVIVAIVGTLYIIDLNRMKNDEPVFFSTWGYKYAPSIKKEETKTNEYTFL